MKRTVKVIAVFAVCFGILADCMLVHAAPASTQPCPRCGTAYYSGSEAVYGQELYSHMHEVAGVGSVPCTYYKVVYVDTYRCGCAAPIRVTRTEYEHHH